jgi:hypothetical protein
MLEQLGTFVAFVAPLGKELLSILTSSLISAKKDKKAAEEKAKKMLFELYLEVNFNLAAFKGFSSADFNKWPVNSKECKAFARQLKTIAMKALLVSIADKKKINESKVYNSMLSLMFSVSELNRISKLTDKMLENQPNFNLPLRLKNIKEHNLLIYNSLFKKPSKKGKVKNE